MKLHLRQWTAAMLLLSVVGLVGGCKSQSGQVAATKPAVVTGVGLYLVRGDASGEFLLRRTFPNSPAAKANLPLNKILYRVNGTFVQPLHISEVSKLVQGPEGTRVFLEFVDPITRQMTQATITRAQFRNESR